MKNHKIAIIDYGMGNLYSIASACRKVGLKPLISRDKKLIMECSAVILPGVGAYNEAMKRLNNWDLIDTINEFVISGKKLFGICLGMQLLFSSSSEFGDTLGLNIIKGKVKKIDALTNNPSLKIPYIGWNKIYQKDIEWDNTYFNGIDQDCRMYFVHSYYVEPDQKQNILAQSYFNTNTFCSAIIYGNIFAVQFHPEKSGDLGLRIYSNFKKEL